jgi:hypothetical protein
MYVIRAEGFANGEHCPHAGEYVESFDHEAHGGQGYGEFTPHLACAMQFATTGEAIEFWRRVPKVRPLRPDGKPNRPLTALSVTFLEMAAAQEDEDERKRSAETE